MADRKRCTQCGILKEPDEFRQYTYSKVKQTAGRYSKCKGCEAINARFARAKESGNVDDIVRITKMYEQLKAIGLRTPLEPSKRDQSDDEIDKILQFHVSKGSILVDREIVDARHEVIVKPVVAVQEDTPNELTHWLTVDFQVWMDSDISPEYLQETIYESLKAKYRPQLYIDRERFVPVFDDTYKEILNKILRRFDEYEEMFSEEGDE